ATQPGSEPIPEGMGSDPGTQFIALMVRSSASRPLSRCSMRAGTGKSGTIQAISSLLPSARET
ncbi:hypothetical protein, partial [Enterobacter hormaechei]|uniref:hypothetical protein n=1 Tax=Enterobacter hormaechei TaxID=158836 RepID=UPI002040E6B0